VRSLQEFFRESLAHVQARKPTVVVGSLAGAGRWVCPHWILVLESLMLTVGMVVLGLAAFAAMLAFVKLCDHV